MATSIASLLTLLACSTDPKPATPTVPAAPAARGPSLLLVTMDTTRVDRIGAYGYAAAETPTIDRIAAEGVRFDQAYAVVPLTTPAHASMFSGLYPTRHGIHSNGDATLREETITLAEQLAEKGYHTAGAVSAFVTTRIWNLDQGFDAYFDKVAAGADARDQRWSRERRAETVVDDLEGWLSTTPEGEPFFAWAHFYDPHAPYTPPAPFDERFKERPYDGEIAYMDAQIARLVALSEARAGPEGVAVILVADHGESFGEKDEHTHGMYAYQSTMRIPFIVRPPKPLPEGRVVTAAVSNVDVAPTALGLLGLDPLKDIDGVDLSVHIKGEAPGRGPVFLEAETPYNRFGFHPEWVAVETPWKLFSTPSPRLYNVVEDPMENVDRLPEQAAVGEALRAFVAEIQAARVENDDFSASAEVIDQLAALGYIASEAGGPMDLEGALDAKDQATLVGRIEKAQRQSQRPKTRKKAEAEMKAILAEHPTMGEMRLSLSRLLSRTGRLQEAHDLLLEGIDHQPQSTLLKSALASVMAQQNRFEDALELVQIVYEQVPGDDLSRFAMLNFMEALGRVEEALQVGHDWLEVEPDNKGLLAIVGILETRFADRAQGEKMLLASLTDDVPRQNVHRTLAILEFSRKNIPAAVPHLEAEVEWFPHKPELRLELGNTYMKLERWDDAAAEFEILHAMVPKRPASRRLWAQALFNSGDPEAAAKTLAPTLTEFPDDPWVLLLHANILGAIGQIEEGDKVFKEAQVLHEALRRSIEKERGVPVLVDPSLEDLTLPGLD